MAKKRVFISFDYDHDETVKDFLVGQGKNQDTPFTFEDWSIKEPLTGNWREKAKARIRSVDVVAVMCGKNTHTATGVSAEITIAQEEKVPYFLLQGYSSGGCTRPKAATATDKLYDWSWANLKTLVGGGR